MCSARGHGAWPHWVAGNRLDEASAVAQAHVSVCCDSWLGGVHDTGTSRVLTCVLVNVRHTTMQRIETEARACFYTCQISKEAT